MTRLDLVNSLIQECGVSGGPVSTAVGLTGSQLRCATWVDAAWNEVQTEHDDWDWMRSSNLLGSGASFVTLPGIATYPLGTTAGQVGIAVDSFGKWDRETFRCYTTTVGTNDEQFLDNIPYDVWRDGYMLGALRSVQTRPYVVAVGPDQSVNVGPPSNGLYTITADYFVAPSVMTADGNVPTGLPLRFHMLIVYRAMMKYASFESAPEVYSRGQSEYNLMFNQLEAVRLPQISFAGAL